MKKNKTLIAHMRESDKQPQSVWEHLCGVSEITGRFADVVGLREAGELLGLVHDLGKASENFQQYIQSGVGMIDPDSDDYVDTEKFKGRIDHSSAGAQLMFSYLKNEKDGLLTGQFLALCVASHHSGMIDCLSPSGENVFDRRMEKSEDFTHTQEAFSRLEESQRNLIMQKLSDEKIRNSIITTLSTLKENSDTKDTLTFKFGLLIRFMYSCLIDADRIDTADFEHPENKQVRQYGNYVHWDELLNRLNIKIKEFENKENKNYVDELRNRVSQTCFEFAPKPRGIYQLSVPTGGGKTFSSLRFALNHAKANNMDRVFYIIPYTSIIDQNASEVRKAMNDCDEKGNPLDRIVLEHHSNLTPDEESHKQKILSQNWDAPIVFTTQVQFLESLFGSATGSARRMHQLANSVIIFDEIQTIPLRCVHLFNVAVRFLVNNCRCSVVLSTATQPLLNEIKSVERSLPIMPENKIISYEKELFSSLQRTRILDERKPGGWDVNEITRLALDELDSSRSVLIVVNTKRSALQLFQKLSEQKPDLVFHLSTNMCPAHRLDVLSEIRQRLENKIPVICVSTQLIEAGVDIDFGSVIRYLAGLDSIAQAAGRCNRNGIRTTGNVWIVNPADENLDRLVDIRVGAEKTNRMLDDFKADPQRFSNSRLSPELMEEYYRHYFYEREDVMTYPVSEQSVIGRHDDIFNLLSTNSISTDNWKKKGLVGKILPFKQSFQSASRAFRVIDTVSKGVVVPYKTRGKEIIAGLCGEWYGNSQFYWLRQAQRYSINTFENAFMQLARSGGVREVKPESGIFYLDEQYYNEKYGLCEEPGNELSLLCF